MKRSTIRMVEDILRDYPKIDKYIEQAENFFIKKCAKGLGLYEL